MKNLIIAFIAITTFTLQAQKKVQKNIDYNGQHVIVEFPFASTIEIKTWNKATIQVDAEAETEKQKYTDLFDVTIENGSSKIEISSNTKEIFKIHEKEEGVFSKLHINDLDHKFTYTLYVPKDIELELSSITGNVSSNFIQGKIQMDLVTGDINIKEFKGDLKLKTVTGEINMPVKDTSLEAKTLMGSIYGAEDPKFIKKDSFIGHEIKMNSESSNYLTLDTVNGDIHLD